MEDENKSLFNAGVAKLKRIDTLKYKIHLYRESGDYDSWYSILCGWREEMSERMKKDEPAECDKFENNIKVLLDSNKKDICEIQLKKYGLYLSKIEYQYGYSMPDKESASHALR